MVKGRTEHCRSERRFELPSVAPSGKRSSWDAFEVASVKGVEGRRVLTFPGTNSWCGFFAIFSVSAYVW